MDTLIIRSLATTSALVLMGCLLSSALLTVLALVSNLYRIASLLRLTVARLALGVVNLSQLAGGFSSVLFLIVICLIFTGFQGTMVFVLSVFTTARVGRE